MANIKLKSLLGEEKSNIIKEDLYTTAGAMIPQVGPATPKNSKESHSDSNDEKRWKNWVGDDANEKKLMKVTDEYYKWLGSEISKLENMYKSGPYQMHLASLKSGGSSRNDYDYLGNLIKTMKQNKAGEKNYR
jgi:hypothetical protein